ncbi:unnamed protein product [Blepharisma stoltei]|uniref:Uncharacterized protein n=1 Tax=Blepharisma stoltei TaxID=1481888 RepID=A0AAU9JDI1_9CILI|nr:unnamed protein product [Blepharisma stoltei]
MRFFYFMRTPLMESFDLKMARFSINLPATDIKMIGWLHAILKYIIKVKEISRKNGLRVYIRLNYSTSLTHHITKINCGVLGFLGFWVFAFLGFWVFGLLHNFSDINSRIVLAAIYALHAKFVKYVNQAICGL